MTPYIHISSHHRYRVHPEYLAPGSKHGDGQVRAASPQQQPRRHWAVPRAPWGLSTARSPSCPAILLIPSVRWEGARLLPVFKRTMKNNVSFVLGVSLKTYIREQEQHARSRSLPSPEGEELSEGKERGINTLGTVPLLNSVPSAQVSGSYLSGFMHFKPSNIFYQWDMAPVA